MNVSELLTNECTCSRYTVRSPILLIQVFSTYVRIYSKSYDCRYNAPVACWRLSDGVNEPVMRGARPPVSRTDPPPTSISAACFNHNTIAESVE